MYHQKEKNQIGIIQMKKINYNKPFIVGKELYNIAQAVIENKKLSGDGEFTAKCQQWLNNTLSTEKTLLTNSCTAALEMAALLADIQPGDEVIMPSFTFVSTANAFVLRGGIPVFIDIRKDTLNMDETKIEAAITAKTKAIVPVHYAGYPCEMDRIMDIAKKYNLIVIEDAAQALLSEYKGKKLGTIGDFGTLSFHETKNIISGEGGALLVNNPEYSERSEVIWEKGTNRKQFFRGEVNKYTWVDLGSSFLPSEITAAFLWAQLENAEIIIEDRKKSCNSYYEHLKELQSSGKVILPHRQKDLIANGHIFYLITRTSEEQAALIQHLNKSLIKAIFHYVPLHSSPAGLNFGRSHGTMDITDDLSSRIVRLPLYYGLINEEIQRVVKCILGFYKER